MQGLSGITENIGRQYGAARDHYTRSLALAERSGNQAIQGTVLMSLALLDARADTGLGDTALINAVATLYRNRNWANTWHAVEGLALRWLRTDRIEPAAIVLGHLQAHDIRHTTFARQRRRAHETLARISQADAWMAHGAALDRDELIDYLTQQKPEPVKT